MHGLIRHLALDAEEILLNASQDVRRTVIYGRGMSSKVAMVQPQGVQVFTDHECPLPQVVDGDTARLRWTGRGHEWG